MINLAAYRHISLDLWLTLIKSDPAFKLERNDLLKNHFGIRYDEQQIGDCVRRYDILFNTINEKTGKNIDSTEMWWVILESLGVDVADTTVACMEEFEKKAEDLFFHYPPSLLDKNTPAILSMLRQQDISLSVLSNTAFIKGKLLRKLLNMLRIADYFDFQLYSDELGFSKPDRQIFHELYTQACAIRPVNASEILHIGDNPLADVRGAIDYGMNAVQFDYQTKIFSDCFAI